MRAVSRDQATGLIGRIATATVWGDLDHSKLQKEVIEGLSDEEFGERITSFLKQGAPYVRAVPRTLEVDASIYPGNVNRNWTTWRGNLDGNGLTGEAHRDNFGFSSVYDFTRLCFAGGDSDSFTARAVYEVYRKSLNLPGLRFGVALFRDWEINEENSILDYFNATFGIEYLTFMGEVIYGRDKEPFFYGLYCRGDGVWEVSPTPLSDVLLSRERIPIYMS